MWYIWITHKAGLLITVLQPPFFSLYIEKEPSIRLFFSVLYQLPDICHTIAIIILVKSYYKKSSLIARLFYYFIEFLSFRDITHEFSWIIL